MRENGWKLEGWWTRVLGRSEDGAYLGETILKGFFKDSKKMW